MFFVFFVFFFLCVFFVSCVCVKNFIKQKYGNYWSQSHSGIFVSCDIQSYVQSIRLPDLFLILKILRTSPSGPILVTWSRKGCPFSNPYHLGVNQIGPVLLMWIPFGRNLRDHYLNWSIWSVTKREFGYGAWSIIFS